MPCAIFKGYRGTSYPDINPDIKFITCPFTGELLTAVPAINPDVTLIHAQQVDRLNLADALSKTPFAAEIPDFLCEAHTLLYQEPEKRLSQS